MRFDKSKDPAAVVAKEASRYAIQGVAAIDRGADTFLCATDGRALTLVRAYPDDGDDAQDGRRIYPAAAFSAARKAARRRHEAALVLNGAAYVDGADGSHAEYPKLDGTFPDVLSALPKGEPVATVKLDAEYLARIQKALGADGVEVRVHGEGLPLSIVPIYLQGPGVQDGSLGILMPIGRGACAADGVVGGGR